MTVIAHRINTVEELRTLPPEYGVEIDVRAYDGRLILSHDPYQSGELLADYLETVGNRFVVFNIKESGIEDDVIDLASRHDVSDYFLLDAEFPYIYQASRGSSFRKMAVRFSEAEPVETALAGFGLTRTPIYRSVNKNTPDYLRRDTRSVWSVRGDGADRKT
jgi:hypothetical protein